MVLCTREIRLARPTSSGVESGVMLVVSLHKAEKLIALSAGGLALALLANSTWASSSQGLLKSTLTIKANCQFLATSEVNFGTVDPLAPANVSGNGSISVVCTKGITIS